MVLYYDTLLTINESQPTNNKWTFGKPNSKTGYLEIASVRIHRIVATAFHGEPPTKEHVVDHIDTNKQNNRPANLRWVTRLENILLNPITARRIEIVCGSVEAFLADPSKFRDKFPDPNYEWDVCRSAEEAQASKKKDLLAWAESDKPLQGGSLGEWIYNQKCANQFN
ncbi:MAG: HNH endonuclease signature motif containing protein [Bacteroidales bacterium]|nr:HNH endonuclease signature motif containing protein [Bacteroidales bacterium]